MTWSWMIDKGTTVNLMTLLYIQLSSTSRQANKSTQCHVTLALQVGLLKKGSPHILNQHAGESGASQFEYSKHQREN